MKKILFCIGLFLTACGPAADDNKESNGMVKLITVDPGHFHAALVQKSMYDNVDSVVHVYAPGGPDIGLHLDRIEAFNTRPNNPTHWKEEVYTGEDFFEKMIEEKKGNVVVLAGNNKLKTEYILQSIRAGYSVLADKPMAINAANFETLVQAFKEAKEKNLLLYDIMTERHEITTMLQREFSLIPEVFGELEKGTEGNPAVTKESVHCFYKYVSGSILTRPAWSFDVTQEGEGIVDVATHLVDLIQWECFPGQIIDFDKDIEMNSARRWPTEVTRSQFAGMTKVDSFPEYLKNDIIKDSVLNVFSNGEINYTIKGVHAKVSVTWVYKAPEGGGDTHYSVMRGTKASLIIRQGEEQEYKPTLYIEPLANEEAYKSQLMEKMKDIQAKYPGVSLKENENGWEVIIPEKYKEGHEAHFTRVTENFLDYLQNGTIPDWEVPNMITKYHITTRALEMAKE